MDEYRARRAALTEAHVAFLRSVAEHTLLRLQWSSSKRLLEARCEACRAQAAALESACARVLEALHAQPASVERNAEYERIGQIRASLALHLQALAADPEPANDDPEQ